MLYTLPSSVSNLYLQTLPHFPRHILLQPSRSHTACHLRNLNHLLPAIPRTRPLVLQRHPHRLLGVLDTEEHRHLQLQEAITLAHPSCTTTWLRHATTWTCSWVWCASSSSSTTCFGNGWATALCPGCSGNPSRGSAGEWNSLDPGLFSLFDPAIHYSKASLELYSVEQS